MSQNSIAKIMAGLVVAVVFYRNLARYTLNLPIWVTSPAIPFIASELRTFDSCLRIFRNQTDCIRTIWIQKLENGVNVRQTLNYPFLSVIAKWAKSLIERNFYDFNPHLEHISLGALGDSFYEYLLKAWVQSGQTDVDARQMYDDAMEAIVNNIIQTSSSGLIYASDMKFERLEHKMDHLACFSGKN